MRGSGLGGERGQVFLSPAHPCLGRGCGAVSGDQEPVSVVGDAFLDRMEPRLSG